MSRLVPLRHQGDVDSPDSAAVRIAASIGIGGECFSVWTRQRDEEKRGHARTEQSISGWICRQLGPEATAIEFEAVPFIPRFVQPLPNGEHLLVASRCRWTPAGGEHNAVIVDADGRVQHSGVFGDGIQDVQTTAQGEIWVSYFDEGVFGNRGWGSPGDEPVGSHGLVRFDRDLTPAWEYPEGAMGRWGWMADCYALNVDQHGAWICYYTDFPLVRIGRNGITGWTNTVARGAHGLIVTGRTAALVGTYEAHDRVAIARLGDSYLTLQDTVTLTLPDGQPLPRGRLIARETALHLLTDTEWFALDIAEL